MDEIKAISRILKDLMEIEDRLDECSKKHKTVPRKKPIKRFNRKPIFRPGKWSDMMDRPVVGDTVFTIYVPQDEKDEDEYAILENEFSGSNMQLLMLAQGRLFLDWEEAEMYMSQCKAVIAAMKAQLTD